MSLNVTKLSTELWLFFKSIRDTQPVGRMKNSWETFLYINYYVYSAKRCTHNMVILAIQWLGNTLLCSLWDIFLYWHALWHYESYEIIDFFHISYTQRGYKCNIMDINANWSEAISESQFTERTRLLESCILWHSPLRIQSLWKQRATVRDDPWKVFRWNKHEDRPCWPYVGETNPISMLTRAGVCFIPGPCRTKCGVKWQGQRSVILAWES